jgi:MFS transporter, DHA3 family, macrolide efflux protein
MNDYQKIKKATYHLYTFTISKMISSFGAQVYAFAISFYILQVTGSASSFAMNLICNILPRTIIAPFAGAITDKYSRKAIVITAQIATTLTIIGLLIVTLSTGLSLIAIYTTTSILAIASSFSGIAFSSSITGLIDKERIQKAMSLNQMSISFAAIGSPAVGGLLYGAVSIPVFLIIYITASSLAVLLEATMNFRLFSNQKETIVGEPKETMLQSIKAGFQYLKLQPAILTMMWVALLINFLFGAFEVGYSYILIDQMKMKSQHFGFTQGAFSIGMLLMSIYFSVRKEFRFPLVLTKRGMVMLGTIIGAVSLPLLVSLSYWETFTYYVILMFGFGSMVILVNTPLQVMMQKSVADDYKGRVFSLLETMAMALMPLGMVLYGFLYDVFPGEWILILSGGLLVSVVLILLRPTVIREIHPEIVEEKGTMVTTTNHVG